MHASSILMPRSKTLLAIGLCLPLTLAAQNKPEEFSLAIPITTTSAAAFYRVTIPLAAYLHSAHSDLRDLRVFNAAGQAVPFARLANTGSNEKSTRHEALRWFPLYASATNNAGNQSLSLVVRQSSDGTLVELNSRKRELSATRDARVIRGVIKGYVLDASKLTGRENIRALDIDWSGGDNSFQLLDVEASADLQNWRTVRSGVQLARLEFQGARIERKRIDLSGLGGLNGLGNERYLRLLWREPGVAPQLTAASVEQITTRWQAAPPIWSDPVQAITSKPSAAPSEFAYLLPHALPITALRFQLPEGNVLLPIDILRPGRERQPAQLLTHSVLYRIESKGHQWAQNEVTLPAYGGNAAQNVALDSLLIRIDPRSGSSTQPLPLSFALNPDQLVFLASGKPPFTLVVGNRAAKDSALQASTLIPGFDNPQTSPQTFEIADATALAASEPTAMQSSALESEDMFANAKGKTIALWSVLALGVLAMAAMAFHLIKQMKADPPVDR